MILLFGIAAGIAIALFRGGDLRNLGEIRIRWAWVALAALTIQVLLFRLPPARTGPARLFFPLVHAAILAVAWVNRDLKGMRLLAAGVALNFAVMVANGGFMPVAPEVLAQAGIAESPEAVGLHTRLAHSKDVVLSRDETALWWLSDIIALRPIQTIVSIGDILIAIGMFLLVQGAMLQREDLIDGN